MLLTDKDLLTNVINEIPKALRDIEKFIKAMPEATKGTDGMIDKLSLWHPLDDSIVSQLRDIHDHLNGHDDLYVHVEKVKALWNALLENGIKCLRFYDSREAYSTSTTTKEPVVYGFDVLKGYFGQYTEFEAMLYGSTKSYRDHVIHVFRTWLTGIYILLCVKVGVESKNRVYQEMAIEGVTEDTFLYHPLVILSMWTVAALCHDLGYPLEQSQRIFSRTKAMMEFFVSSPKFNLDVSFSGIQDYINDYILRLISSKMIPYGPKATADGSTPSSSAYSGRVQPKYYIKFAKSLEKYSHGIVSSIILYKTLTYFLESDFNVNEDYKFTRIDAKEFYIRREILRAMAAHTCPDIYHLKPSTLSFLLIVCDELQQWDRRRFADFYAGSKDIKSDISLEQFSQEGLDIRETIKDVKMESITDALMSIYYQYEYYKKIFRDGQDTSQRTFDFQKWHELLCDGKKITARYVIPKDATSSFEIRVPVTETQLKERVMGLRDFLHCEHSVESRYFVCKILGIKR